MASPLQGGGQSESPRSSEQASPSHIPLNSDCNIISPRDEVTSGAEPQTTSGSPSPSRVIPQDGEIVRFDDQALYGEAPDAEGLALLDELASAIPAVAEIIEGLAMEAWRALYPSFGYRDPIRTPTLSTGSHRRYDFTCVLCRRVHDRFNRARDCQYQDLGLMPYQCKGACGVAACPVAYNSEERLGRHLSSSVRCPFCHKRISVQNAARHKTVYCLNRPLGPTVPESDAE